MYLFGGFFVLGLFVLEVTRMFPVYSLELCFRLLQGAGLRNARWDVFVRRGVVLNQEYANVQR